VSCLFSKKKIVEGSHDGVFVCSKPMRDRSNVSALLLLPGGLFFFYYTTFTSVVFQNVMQLPVMTTAACALENGGDGFDVCVLLLENYKKYG
jgi:hypothetical protein